MSTRDVVRAAGRLGEPLDPGPDNDKNVTGLILEGIPGSGKTTILNEILRSDAFLDRGYQSSLILTEHQTQRVLESKQAADGLTKDDNVSLLDQHVGTVHALKGNLERMDWATRNRIKHKLCYLFERFHFTHFCHYAHVDWEDVRKADEALAGLGCKVCVLSLEDPALIEERVVSSRPSAAWQAHLRSIASTSRDVVGHYIDQQNLFVELAGASAMPTMVLETSYTQPADIASQVCDFWLHATDNQTDAAKQR